MYYIERVIQSWKAATSTTTICMPEDLKARVAMVAKRAGTTTHALILHAIAKKAEQMNRRAEFDVATEDRYARIVGPGTTISWTRSEIRGYLEGRLAGKAAKPPATRKAMWLCTVTLPKSMPLAVRGPRESGYPERRGQLVLDRP